MSRLRVPGRGIRLEALDYGGAGPGALLLHGLAGTAREWEETASWLTRTHHVVALDQRGHGRSERRPQDVSRAAFVADAIATVETLRLGPALLIGQSLGGHTAFLTAAERPDLVRALVVAEASPAKAGREAAGEVGALLGGWPAPFASRNAALAFFGGDSPRARAWANNLAEDEDGLVPTFDVDVMVAALEAASASAWDRWAAVRAPTLVVVGEKGDLDTEEVFRMTTALPSSELVVLPGGHDVHLDSPEAWRAVVEAFVERVS
jgi:pimeloyl-ACP methyl ester carboxylesterase